MVNCPMQSRQVWLVCKTPNHGHSVNRYPVDCGQLPTRIRPTVITSTIMVITSPHGGFWYVPGTRPDHDPISLGITPSLHKDFRQGRHGDKVVLGWADSHVSVIKGEFLGNEVMYNNSSWFSASKWLKSNVGKMRTTWAESYSGENNWCKIRC